MIIIHTDGANSLKNKIGAAAAIISKDETILTELVEAFKGEKVTNNTMELWAVILGLTYILEHPELGKEVTLISDSEYVVNGASKWLPTWKLKNWKSTTGMVKNRELWEAVDYLKSELSITWQWVRGHGTDKLNNLADELAVKAYTDLLKTHKSS